MNLRLVSWFSFLFLLLSLKGISASQHFHTLTPPVISFLCYPVYYSDLLQRNMDSTIVLSKSKFENVCACPIALKIEPIKQRKIEFAISLMSSYWYYNIFNYQLFFDETEYPNQAFYNANDDYRYYYGPIFYAIFNSPFLSLRIEFNSSHQFYQNAWYRTYTSNTKRWFIIGFNMKLGRLYL